MEKAYVIMQSLMRHNEPAYYYSDTNLPVTYPTKEEAERICRENNVEIYEREDDFCEEDLEWVEECTLLEDGSVQTVADGVFGKRLVNYNNRYV